MNGKTNIDKHMNPSAAEVDKNTWGIPYLFNFTFTGNRLLRVCILCVTFDVYISKHNPMFSYFRINNAGILFLPFGSITWPMPSLHKTND